MGWLRKQEVVQFCAGSPTLWGAAQMVFGVGGDRLVNGLGEIERFCEYKFKTAKSSSNSGFGVRSLERG